MVEIHQCLYRVLYWNMLVHLPKDNVNSTTQLGQRHSVFHSFLSDDNKQDAATNTTHIKCFIALLK